MSEEKRRLDYDEFMQDTFSTEFLIEAEQEYQRLKRCCEEGFCIGCNSPLVHDERNAGVCIVCQSKDAIRLEKQEY
jgi:hypothetical protein